MKNFTTETDVPTLKLSFLVAVSAQEEQVQDIYDEALGKLELGPEGIFFKKIYAAQELFKRGSRLMSSFERTGNLPEISGAISVNQRVVRLTPDGHPDMPRRLSNLGWSFQSRFTRTGDLTDLSEAISIKQQAVQHTPDGHPHIPKYLSNLGNSFQTRFKRTGDLSDLSEAVLIHQRAVQLTPDGYPDMPTFLNNLGTSLQSRFERTGDLSDLSEAILTKRRAVQLTHNGHPQMPMWFNNLGISLQRSFERTGHLSELSEAISIQQRAVQLTPNGHPAMPGRLNNLATSFQSRFKRTGNLSDLSEAISNKQRAVQLTPDGHPDMPKWLNNLGNSLQSRFEHTSDPSDLSEAISTKQKALQLTPDGHPDMPGRSSNLGKSFNSRFQRTGDLSDLSEAISNEQRAVQFTPDGHPYMPVHLNNLGNSLQTRFKLTGNLSDISEAISNQQRAVRLTPDGHPEMPMWLYSLANSFHSRFERTADPADICTAASTFQKSATTKFGLPWVRFNSAQKCAELSMTHNLPYTLSAYGIAINLISEIVGIDSTIQQRHTHLIDISTLTTSAVSAAFAQGETKKALEWLEQGRCLVWSQLNQLRTPLDHLRAQDERLAQRFSDIASALEAAGSRSVSGGLGFDAPLSQKISLQDDAHRHILLSRQWTELLDEIRSIPQFHNFLRPSQTSELIKHLPKDGIVILVNVDESRCDALALVPSSDIPIHVALNDFTHKEASDLRQRLRHFLSSHGVRTREADRGGRPARRPDAEKQSEIHFVLEALWLHVVRPILDGLAFSVSFYQFIIYQLLIYLPSLLHRQI